MNDICLLRDLYHPAAKTGTEMSHNISYRTVHSALMVSNRPWAIARRMIFRKHETQQLVFNVLYNLLLILTYAMEIRFMVLFDDNSSHKYVKLGV
jgi:hypothetical protein